MKKGQVYEAEVERVDFPNRGVAYTEEGFPVIVKNSLPGQKLKLSIHKVRNGRAEGRLLEVLEKSPLETEAPCSHFGLCGGCTYLSLEYDRQLQIKEGQVKCLLVGGLSKQMKPWIWEGIKDSPERYGYRNKMEFSFGDEVKDGPLALGMHKRGSFYDVVTVDDCRIVDKDYRTILRAVLDYFGGAQVDGGVSYYHRLRHEGYLRHLVVRKASRTGEILAALVTTSREPMEAGKPAGEKLKAGFLQCLLDLEQSSALEGHFAGILHIVNDSQADVVRSDCTEVLYGRDYFYEELLGLRFKISAFSFFQTNTAGAEVLYETVREYIREAEDGTGKGAAERVIFDLYSGTGTIAQLMASGARKVIGVEIVEEAVEAARRNARENGIENCEFIAGDVLKILDTIEEKPDLIILDPPRDGVHPRALPKILSYGVEHIVYISCKPTSLARDLGVFVERGYTVDRAVSVDQFPWTANVETVVLLSRRKQK